MSSAGETGTNSHLESGEKQGVGEVPSYMVSQSSYSGGGGGDTVSVWSVTGGHCCNTTAQDSAAAVSEAQRMKNREFFQAP